MGLKTVVLKLYKPGKAKGKIIDEALNNYNEAMGSLIDTAYSNLQQLEKGYKKTGGRYNALALSKWVDSAMSRELNKYNVQPFKDSLKMEFGRIVASILKNNENRDVYPKRKRNKPYPVYFCRYDTNRNYCLLYDKEKDRFFAKLYLLNRSNARDAAGKSRSEKLEYVHRKKGSLQRTGRKEFFIITPLAFGKWQETILKEAMEEPERFRTARLYKKDNEYYLAVSIEGRKSENIETGAFLGVARGLKNILDYTVADREGKVLEHGSTGNLIAMHNAKEIPLSELHKAANFIAEKAAIHKAQTVVLNFSGKDDRLGWTDAEGEYCRPVCSQREYNRFARLLGSKLDWISLPRPVKVSPVGIYTTCPNCGLNARKNRFGMYLFICTGCGTTMDIDALGSLNLAGKLMGYNSSKIRIMVSRTGNGLLFANNLLGLSLFSDNNGDHMQRLKDELVRIITKNTEDIAFENDKNAYSANISLIRKLESSENLFDMLEFYS